MARRGWSTSNFLRAASAVATAAPLTMACWAKTSLTGTAQGVAGIYNSASAANRNLFRLSLGNTNAATAVTADGSTSNNATSSTTISANTWFHICGVFASATSRAVYLNGGGKGTDVVSTVPSGLNRTSIGLQNDNATVNLPFAAAGTGDIAELVVWNIALSDTDVAALANGTHPFLVHPEAIVGYWPLIGNNSPENNWLSNTATMAVQGTLTASPHTRIFMPSRPRFGRKTSLIAAPAVLWKPRRYTVRR